ncbi:MAG TPA: hypothetical protein VF525_01970 [Pyrinomonadaceae bacterium]|jgi:hypothetical protein
MSAQALGRETGTGTGLGTQGGALANRDAAESVLKTIDESTKGATGVSLFHILTIGSIGASLALFFSGNKQAGIFVGLWPPTFQALKSVVDKNKNS